MIPGGHRDATDADALGPGGPTGECPQSISFALPVVACDVTGMLMTHIASLSGLIFRVPSWPILNVLFRIAILPEDGPSPNCASTAQRKN